MCGSSEITNLLQAFIKGKSVFSFHADFYGKGAGYNALAGKDCTRAVAKWSLKEEDMIPDVVRSNTETVTRVNLRPHAFNLLVLL